MYLRSLICESVSISFSVNLQVTIFFHVGPWDAGVTKKLDTRGEVNLHASDYTKKPSGGGVHQMDFFIYIHITFIYYYYYSYYYSYDYYIYIIIIILMIIIYILLLLFLLLFL